MMEANKLENAFPYDKCRLNTSGLLSFYDKNTDIYYESLGREGAIPVELFLIAANDNNGWEEYRGPLFRYLCRTEVGALVAEEGEREVDFFEYEFIETLTHIARTILDTSEELEQKIKEEWLPILYLKAATAVDPTPDIDPKCIPDENPLYGASEEYKEYFKAASAFKKSIIERTKEILSNNGFNIVDEYLIAYEEYQPLKKIFENYSVSV